MRSTLPNGLVAAPLWARNTHHPQRLAEDHNHHHHPWVVVAAAGQTLLHAEQRDNLLELREAGQIPAPEVVDQILAEGEVVRGVDQTPEPEAARQTRLGL